MRAALRHLPAAAALLALALVPAAGAGRQADDDPSARIAFASKRDGDSEIYVIRSDGKSLRKLTSNRAGDYRPVWSPDGTRILFASDRHGNEELYVMRSDGRDVRRLTRHPAADGAPEWSPDGRRVAFTRIGAAGAEVLVMNADGTGVRRVSPKAVRGNGSYTPSWSGAAGRIAFAGSFATPENQEIYTVRPDGSGLRRLTRTKGDVHTLGDDGMPAWHPDGRRIAFTSNRARDGEIWVMRADGSGQRRVAGLRGRDDWAPTWSGDGERIAFASHGAAGGAMLYVVRSDGTGLRRLTAGEDPDWNRPAG